MDPETEITDEEREEMEAPHPFVQAIIDRIEESAQLTGVVDPD